MGNVVRILAVACFIGSCVGCTALKYISPVIVKDGITTGGETFELHKYFVLTKVTGFKIDRKGDGSVKASFDSVENADSKAVDVLADLVKSTMDKVIKIP